MAKKSVTFNIKNVNVRVGNPILEEADQSGQQHKNALDSMVEKLTQVEKSVRSKLATSLIYIGDAAGRVKNDQDFRVIVHAILNQQDDVVLETPEATAFLKELQEKGWFKDNIRAEPKKDIKSASVNVEANGL